ncbi:MAG: class I SAM-dependent methyltransferase, partial [Victivallales bacterium]|nr:class I SAM-dependent methyltransferase [Victivallales bacterium]
ASLELRRQAPTATHAYLIGKGPSLDQLTPTAFPIVDAPILCCNESIHAVEALDLPNPLFCVQQDAALKERCRPQRATWFLSAQAWNAGKGDTYERAVKYDAKGVGGRTRSLTASQSLRILYRAHGFGHVHMLAFDACVTGNCEYAAAIWERANDRHKQPGRFKRFCGIIKRVGKDTGLRLHWDHIGWTVACVLRSGGQYTPEHVRWLHAQVAKHVQPPHRFVCLSDTPEAVPGGIPLRHDWPGWWSKAELFRPGLFQAPVLFLDLDVVLTSAIALPHARTLPVGTMHATEDWWRKGQIQGSVMAWRADSASSVYCRMSGDPARTMATFRDHGDQALVTACMGSRRAELPWRIRSYKAHRADCPGQADIVVFHGDPKPWAVPETWIPPLAAPSQRAAWLRRTVAERDYRTFVEVGVKEGKTTACVAAGAPDCQVYAIDSWRPQPQNKGPENYAKWNFEGIVRDYWRRTSPFGDRIRTIIADALAAPAMIPDQVDIVFLDADHSTEATAAAVAAYLPLVRPGGILAGHDIDWPTVRQALRASGLTYRTAPDNCWYHEVVPADNEGEG